jgi:hypothetical protein
MISANAFPGWVPAPGTVEMPVMIIHITPYVATGFQKKITVKQLKATTVLACKCGNTFLVNGHCRNCEAQAIVDKAKQRGDKNFNFEQAIKQQNQSLRKEANIEAGQRAHKLTMAAESELPYTGRIQNFVGQSRRDIVEPWEGGAAPRRVTGSRSHRTSPVSSNICHQATVANAICRA